MMHFVGDIPPEFVKAVVPKAGKINVFNSDKQGKKHSRNTSWHLKELKGAIGIKTRNSMVLKHLRRHDLAMDKDAYHT